MDIDEVYNNWTTTYGELPMFMTVMVHANPVVVTDAIDYDADEHTSVCNYIFWCLNLVMNG